MAHIIYTETETNRPNLADSFASQVNLDRKYTVWQDASKVSISYSILRTGSVRGTDKRWYKWGTVQAYGFYRNKNGNVVSYQIDRAESLRSTDLWRNRKPLLAFNTLAGDGVNPIITEHFQRAMRETFNISSMFDIYPLAREYDMYQYSGIPANLLPAFRYENPKDAAVVIFGKSRVTPEWGNAIANTDPYIVSVAQQFRGYGKDTDVLGFMKNNHFDEEMEQAFSPNTPQLRPFLPKLHTDSYNFLLSNRLDNMDLKRIRCFASDAMNIKYMLGKATADEPVHNWNELLNMVTGSNF